MIRLTLAAVLAGALGAAGCAVAADEETESTPNKVVGAADSATLLKSTLLLEGGCTAAKVGPRHLLVAAGCVAGKAAFAPGKVLSFTSAAAGKTIVPAESPADAGAAPSDAATSARDGASTGADAGAPDSGSSSPASRDVMIAEIKVPPSYASRCKGALCGLGAVAASDVPDVAVILLDRDLDTVPSIPVDLDPVGEADPLFVVTSGCATLDSRPSAAPRAVRTIAVPTKSASHAGSPYSQSQALVTRLGQSYVLTAGAGWHGTDPRLCNADVGSPIFRAGSFAVAGVIANYTTYEGGSLPVTIHHTRVDASSRFKVGDWLSDLGVETVRSCSETAGGCVDHAYDGGAPPGPAGDVPGDGTTEPGDAGKPDVIVPDAATSADGGAAAPPAPTDPYGDQLPPDGTDDSAASEWENDSDYGDAAAPKKKKKAAAASCSAAPGGPVGSTPMLLALGLVLGAALARRRRAA